MTAITYVRQGWTIRRGVVFGVLQVVIVGLAVLALREAGVVAPDLTLPPSPFVPGAPDIARTLG
jgi:hypothetical protein